MSVSKNLARWAGTLALSCCWMGAAQAAQDYPTQPIHIIVPVAPGGGTDFAARLLAEELSGVLGQPVVVENRPGGAGNVGVAAVARAAPDGYTLVMPITSFPINPALYKDLPFDTRKDLQPIALVGSFPLLLVVSPRLQVDSVQGLITHAKTHPNTVNFANSGTGTTAHLAGELFKRMADVQITSVAYKGGGPAVTDLLGGHVQMYFSTIPAVTGHVKAGALRPLGVTGKQRVADLPDVPTLDEAGLPGFDVTAWFGLFAPAGTPPEIIAKLNKASADVLSRPDVRRKMTEQGFHAGGNLNPDEVREFVNGDMDKWQKLVADIGLKLQ